MVFNSTFVGAARFCSKAQFHSRLLVGKSRYYNSRQLKSVHTSAFNGSNSGSSIKVCVKPTLRNLAENPTLTSDFSTSTAAKIGTMPGIKVSTDSIAKSQQDKRLYRGIVLENGLKVLLISDPETDKSAAAMDVHIGSMSDPRNIPGLAHFCEHMLFLGTKKYPDENEYNKCLSQNGGSSNAFTTSDHTNYYFDVSPDKLEDALDRFSQFFISPLFTESATEREMKAVNSEHEKNIPNDAWRISQLEKTLANPSHDFSKFGTGNTQTLDIIPKEQNISVREELLKFHNTWYSSNIMGFVVLGKQDLDTLQEIVLKMMLEVKNLEVEVPRWEDPPFKEDQLATITYVMPVKDIRQLNITFGIPDLSSEYKSSPGSYLGHLIGHEGPGSLLSELKSRGWVNTLVGGQKSGSKGFGFFVVNVDLTQEGIEHVDDIIALVFQYFAMLKKEGPQKWIYEECRDLNAMQFRFKDKERPQGYVASMAGLLHDYPIEEVLTGGYLISEWNPEQISSLLDHLTPDRVRVAVIAQKFKDICDSEEQYYGAKYKVEKIDNSKIETWKSCSLNPKFRLPDKNEFIPTNFDLKARDGYPSDHPTIIQEDNLGRLWFKQDDEFLLPKTCINIEMQSPVAYCDPHHANLTYMFAYLFKDALNEYVYAAELAGLGYNLANTKYGITLGIKGYSDKQKVLLEKIIDKLTSFKIDSNRFEILRENYIRGLKNSVADQPHQHAIYYNSVVLTEKVWHKEELLSSVDILTVEALQNFIPRLLANVKLECLVYGNSTMEEAASIYSLVSNKLKQESGSRPLLASQTLKEREIQLTNPSYLYQTKNEIHKTSSIEIYYQCGIQETRTNMLLELLAQIIKEPCFHQLRTKEQLGYIVFSGLRRSNIVQGLRVIVQSDRHPEYLDERVENYIQTLKDTLQGMSDEEFESHKEALAAKRLEKPKKLSTKNGKYWAEILSEHLHFDRDNIEVEELRKFTKDDIINFYSKHICPNSSDRRKLSCHVVSHAPDGAGLTTQSETKPDSIHCISNITRFKAGQPLYPLASPYTPHDKLKRNSEVKEVP